MKLILLTIATIVGMAIPAELDFSGMEPATMAIESEEGTLTLLTSEKCFSTVGENMSRISIKGTEADVKIKANLPFNFYVRRDPTKKMLTFSIVKLENNGKKRVAQYNSVTGKKITAYRVGGGEVNAQLKIMRFRFEGLPPGNYCAIFKNVYNGNFTMLGDYPANACFFDVIE